MQAHLRRPSHKVSGRLQRQRAGLRHLQLHTRLRQRLRFAGSQQTLLIRPSEV